MANTRLKLKKNQTPAICQKPDLQKLNDPVTGDGFHVSVETKWEKLLEKSVGNVDEHWNKAKEIIVDTSTEVLGQKPKQHHMDWLSYYTLQLMNEKYRYKSMKKDSPEWLSITIIFAGQ